MRTFQKVHCSTKHEEHLQMTAPAVEAPLTCQRNGCSSSVVAPGVLLLSDSQCFVCIQRHHSVCDGRNRGERLTGERLLIALHRQPRNSFNLSAGLTGDLALKHQGD